MITNIQGYSIHDGPGIRTVVFMKGCPLRCTWCANPENLSSRAQTGFLKNLCTGCGRCVNACPHGAIVADGAYRIARDKCVSCGECVDACYYGALVRYGEVMTAAQVFDSVRRDKIFYDSSGGGVTVSGGEPLLRPDFVYELFSMCKDDGINTCAETCGCVSKDAFDRVLPVTDLFCFDIKLIADSQKHTGVDSLAILDNARYITERGANVLFRQPLVPGITDTEDNITLTAKFLAELGAGIELMPYHRAGTPKYEALGMEFVNLTPQSQEQIAKSRDMYLKLGVSCTVSK